MAEPNVNIYDEVPYEGHAFEESHPDHLATIGTLYGMTPQSSDSCRVLELGCAEGSNLIPMAARLPGSEFVGIDASARQIEAGRNVIAKLELGNIRLEQGDIREINDSLGQFDYVIAHGVYSWVGADVRDALLAAVQRSLKPQGVGYVSYSTLPGGHLRSMVREMMFYHARGEQDALRQVARGRELLDFLIEAAPADSVQRACLEWEKVNIASLPDHHIRHDSLEPDNHPVYFAEFVEHAGRHGLQYVADASFQANCTYDLSDETKQRLNDFAETRLEAEQYVDFIRNRSLRTSLLCRKDVAITPEIDTGRLTALRIASPLRILQGTPADVALPGRAVAFGLGDRPALQADEPLTKTAFRILEEAWPESLPFNALVEETHQRTASDQVAETGADARSRLAHTLFECFSRKLVRLSVGEGTPTAHVAERPKTNPLVRLQAAGSTSVTNEFHSVVPVDMVQRIVLNKLDGKTPREEIVELLVKLAQQGELQVHENGAPVADEQQLRESLGRHVDAYLTGFRRSALLVA